MSSIPANDDLDDEGTLLLEQRFSIVPEWVLDAEISDAALRLYAVLLRYGQTSGNRMPSRGLLASRLRKKSKDTVDRALKELVGIGAVIVQRRRQGPVNLTNRYIVRSTPPRLSPEPATTSTEAVARGGRTDAAPPETAQGGPIPAATPGRTVAATVAAGLRPDPEPSTQSIPPPPAPSGTSGGGGSDGDRQTQLLQALGITRDDLEAVVERCRASRRSLALPVTRWTRRTLTEVLAAAVLDCAWPAAAAIPALLDLAADRATRSPARLSCAGPWWDTAETAARRASNDVDADELAHLEAILSETGGVRVTVQRLARKELAAAGEPVTRLAVARLANRILRAEADAEGVV